MKAVLIAIDFSATCSQMGLYAALITQQLEASQMILYHSYWGSEEAHGAISASTQAQCHQALQRLAHQWRPYMDPKIELICLADNQPLAIGIQQNIALHDVGLVMTGQSSRKGWRVKIFGSHTIQLAEKCPVPVLVVPPGYVAHRPIRKITFACAQDHLEERFPVQNFKALLHDLQTELHVLRISDDEKEIPKEFQMALCDLLAYRKIQFHNRSADKVAKGLLSFVQEMDMDVLCTMPGQYGPIQALFHHYVSHELSEKSPIPVLIIPQKTNPKAILEN